MHSTAAAVQGSGGRTRRVFAPRGVLRELFERRDDQLLISGPAGTGKSRACLEKLHMAALKYPGMRALMVRKTLVSLTAAGLVTWREKVIAEALAAGIVTYFGGNKERPAAYEYANGSVIVVGGLDRADKIMSTEYDMIYAQEAVELTIKDWENCTTRLRNGVMPYQQIIADCNPDAPFHWLNQRCERGDCVMLHSRHQDNPVYYVYDSNTYSLTDVGVSYLAKLDKLTGVRKLRLRDGKWAAAEGLVFDEYDPAIHLIPRIRIPHEWRHFWTVDFGFVHPFVLQCWAEDPDGRLYMYREIYMTHRLVEDHARTIKAAMWDREPWPERIICDHDAEDRATLERHLGRPTYPAHKSVSDGLQAAQARFRDRGDGKPGVFFLESSLIERDPVLVADSMPTCTVEEFGGYVWQDPKKKAEGPVKEMDDGSDAYRYMVADRDVKLHGARARALDPGARRRVRA